MVDAMRFRPLDQIAEPLRRVHIHVLEVAVERRDVTGQRRRHRIEAENQRRRDGCQHEEHDRFQWVE